jgi:hypothetical protein
MPCKLVLGFPQISVRLEAQQVVPELDSYGSRRPNLIEAIFVIPSHRVVAELAEVELDLDRNGVASVCLLATDSDRRL